MWAAAQNRSAPSGSRARQSTPTDQATRLQKDGLSESGQWGIDRLRFYDLFSGIGGFHLGLSRAGHECVGACENDKYARDVYGRHFPGVPIHEDATTLDPGRLPDFDILVAGIPCQPFSVAGLRQGFDDARGTLFLKSLGCSKPSDHAFVSLKTCRAYSVTQAGRLLPASSRSWMG